MSLPARAAGGQTMRGNIHMRRSDRRTRRLAVALLCCLPLLLMPATGHAAYACEITSPTLRLPVGYVGTQRVYAWLTNMSTAGEIISTEPDAFAAVSPLPSGIRYNPPPPAPFLPSGLGVYAVVIIDPGLAAGTYTLIFEWTYSYNGGSTFETTNCTVTIIVGDVDAGAGTDAGSGEPLFVATGPEVPTGVLRISYARGAVLELREGPGDEHPVVARVAADETLYAYQYDGEWAYVETADGAVRTALLG